MLICDKCKMQPPLQLLIDGEQDKWIVIVIRQVVRGIKERGYELDV